MPGLGCDSNRGDTTCVGAKTFPYPKKGVCSCSSGQCDGSGHCTAATPSPDAFGGSLYEVKPRGEVPPEDFTLVFACMGLVGASLAVGAAVLGLRVRRVGRQAPGVREALVAEGDMTEEECIE